MSINYSITRFREKTLENIQKRLRLKLNRKDDNEENIQKQSKETFNGIQKTLTNYKSYAFEQNKTIMDEMSFSGFSVSEMCKLLMFDTYFDK